MKPTLQKKLKAKAEENTTITQGTKANQTPIKQGVPAEHSTKHDPAYPVKFGMSKGITKNMDNYESLRVDVWLSDEVQEGESLQEAFTRIEKIIDDTLESAVLSTIG